ncbi:MAG: nickel pincer cofactor biosynthesis protein LarC, partial [Candidatus Syntropharchaeia archaeon]
MKILVFDPFSGASGDMIVGALLDLGADEFFVRDKVEGTGAKMEVRETKKQGIRAKKVNFITDKKERKYDEVMEILENLDDFLLDDVLGIFERIASAESRVHGMPKETLVFHEIGDSIADIVGACAAFHALGLRRFEVHSTCLSVGGGFVECKHGRLPVPAPVTVEILSHSNLIYRGGPVECELLTPTGAGILAHFVHRCEAFLPRMEIEKTGYGAGDRDLEIPNVLRVMIGEGGDALVREEIEVLETNVDDVTGEVLGNLIGDLIEMGAKDVAIIPAMMKKGRSGHIIQVITESKDTPRMARKIMEETGTLGVRVIPTRHRLIARRKMDSVTIEIKGIKREIPVKIATDTEGRILNISTEFEYARRIA